MIIKAADAEKKVEVHQQDLISTPQDHEFLYSINKRVEFDLAYGVTKVTVKGFYVRKIGGKVLAFFNDLSLKKVLDSQDLLKYECQLFGESKTHAASLYVHLQRQGEAKPKYNIFAEVANRIKINQQQYLAQHPEVIREIEE